MTYVIRDREAGNYITRFDTLDEAKAEIEKYENKDKEDGSYSKDFYEIVEYKDRYIIFRNRNCIEHYKFVPLDWMRLSDKDKIGMIDNDRKNGERIDDTVFESYDREEAETKFKELIKSLYSYYAPSQNELVLEELFLGKEILDEDGDGFDFDCLAYCFEDISLNEYIDEASKALVEEFDELDIDWVVRNIQYWYKDAALPDADSKEYRREVMKIYVRHELETYYSLTSAEDIEKIVQECSANYEKYRRLV